MKNGILGRAPSTEKMKLLVFFVLCLATITSSNATPIKVAILTGANNHNWKETTPLLQKILQETGNFKVEVFTDPETLTTTRLATFDILLSNWNAYGKEKPPSWSNSLKESYIQFVKNGGGHIVVHAGSSSHYDWDAYHSACLATWKNGTNHGKIKDFEVRITTPKHPITIGLESFETSDELWCQPYIQPGATTLAESFSSRTGNWEPTAFAGTFGTGRCFTLLLGHDVNSMNHKGFKTLLIRGAKWTANHHALEE